MYEKPKVVAYLLTSDVVYCRDCRERINFAPVLIKAGLEAKDLARDSRCDFCGKIIKTQHLIGDFDMPKDLANTETMRRAAADLLKFTVGVHPEFHEPQEAGIDIVDVVGRLLDNAMGSKIYSEGIERGFQEIVVILRRVVEDADYEIRFESFNLATLFALARIGAVQLLCDHAKEQGES